MLEKEGIEQGREEGKQVALRENAKVMKTKGCEFQFIHEITNLSLGEIEKL